MQKDFDGWNDSKKKLHRQVFAPLYHRREVWWVSLGVNIGTEIDGTGKQYDRPVVVIKGFNENQCFTVALTGRYRKDPYHYPVGIVGDREASAVLSQIRIVDTKRFVKKIGMLDEAIYDKLLEHLKETL